MTDTTDQEAIALAEVNAAHPYTHWNDIRDVGQGALVKTLCRAIERHKTDIADLQAEYEEVCKLHEAFRQEVSDVFEATISALDQLVLGERDEAMVRGIRIATARFIIAKSDPLAEAIKETHDFDDYDFDIWADQLRAAIEKRGGKIVWGEG